MCTVLLPPGGHPIAVNEYIISNLAGNRTYFAAITLHEPNFIQSYQNSTIYDTNKTDSSEWSGNMDDEEEGRTSTANFWKENI